MGRGRGGAEEIFYGSSAIDTSSKSFALIDERDLQSLLDDGSSAAFASRYRESEGAGELWPLAAGMAAAASLEKEGFDSYQAESMSREDLEELGEAFGGAEGLFGFGDEVSLERAREVAKRHRGQNVLQPLATWFAASYDLLALSESERKEILSSEEMDDMAQQMIARFLALRMERHCRMYFPAPEKELAYSISHSGKTVHLRSPQDKGALCHVPGVLAPEGRTAYAAWAEAGGPERPKRCPHCEKIAAGKPEIFLELGNESMTKPLHLFSEEACQDIADAVAIGADLRFLLATRSPREHPSMLDASEASILSKELDRREGEHPLAAFPGISSQEVRGAGEEKRRAAVRSIVKNEYQTPKGVAEGVQHALRFPF